MGRVAVTVYVTVPDEAHYTTEEVAASSIVFNSLKELGLKVSIHVANSERRDR